MTEEPMTMEEAFAKQTGENLFYFTQHTEPPMKGIHVKMFKRKDGFPNARVLGIHFDLPVLEMLP